MDQQTKEYISNAIELGVPLEKIIESTSKKFKVSVEEVKSYIEDPEDNYPDISAKGIPVKDSFNNYKYFCKVQKIEFQKCLGRIIARQRGGTWREFDEPGLVDIAAMISSNPYKCSKTCIKDWSQKLGRGQKDWLQEWAYSKSWDGIDRVKELYLTLKNNFDDDFEYLGFRKFIHGYISLALDLRSVDEQDPRSEIVLIFKGIEGTGKSAWAQLLVPRNCPVELFTEGAINPKSKDDHIKKSTHLIWAVNEIDSVLSKYEIGSTKDFITANKTSERSSYAHLSQDHRKICSFVASTNDYYFLPAGETNRRFFVIEPKDNINYTHKVNLQQVFAQVIEERKAGFSNWFSPEEIEINKARCQKWVSPDSLTEWLKDYVVVQEGKGFSQNKLWMQYVGYCSSRKFIPSGLKAFEERLWKMGADKTYNKHEKLSHWNLDRRLKLV